MVLSPRPSSKPPMGTLSLTTPITCSGVWLVRNEEGGLKNMMDIDDIVMWDDDTPMKVTGEASFISPSLTDFASDRPFHVMNSTGNWEVEVSLAQNDDGTRADPIIVRDGNLGRLIPVIQTNGGDEPKGAVAAEIIIYLMDSVSG
ncbi:hypothetical protein GBAR_LOCUS7046 [Geodia barretti]|uniref:Uncharacterized protein n=1 Tax=Geodia barretti TaxID=519541 RepID=A0AA35RFW3_GEOBA|nr:hypothetical protein GBAR_LOCUS7046 [Geodia barretti]